jgi:hypothetical protein
MAERHEPPQEAPTPSSLLAGLEELRTAHADDSEDQRREALRSHLENVLGNLPDHDARRLVDDATSIVIERARTRQQGAAETPGELSRVAAERDRLRDECERLKQASESASRDEVSDAGSLRAQLEESQREIQTLRGQLDQARRAAPAGAPGSEAPGDTQALVEGLFRALKSMLDAGNFDDPPASEPPAGTDPIYDVMRELIRFPLVFELKRYEFLWSLLPPGHTGIEKSLKRQARRRFEACLDREEGAVDQLREALAKNLEFLVHLNQAYQSAIASCVREILEGLDPNAVLEEAGRNILKQYDYQQAFRIFERRQTDMRRLSDEELITRFFYEPFKRELSERLD